MPNVCRRSDCQATHLHVLLARGSDLPTDLFAGFRRTFEIAKRFGAQDYNAFVRYLVSRRLGDPNARSEFTDYASLHRRERGPLPPMLADAMRHEPGAPHREDGENRGGVGGENQTREHHTTPPASHVPLTTIPDNRPEQLPPDQ